jgi:hypothetical protein
MAAQIAMHSQPMEQQHSRKRSQTLPDPSGNNGTPPNQPLPQRWPLAAERSFNVNSSNGLRNMDGFIGGHSLAAATAAQVAVHPRSPQYTPAVIDRAPPVPEKDPRVVKKETKGIKLFSKPSKIGVLRDKDFDKKHPAMPSPGKMLSNLRLGNSSMTSLVDSSSSSLYTITNGSTSTLVPDQANRPAEKEKEKHRHFLSRQKHKYWDKDESYHSSSSYLKDSRTKDPSAPAPLYSFTENTPAYPGAFSKQLAAGKKKDAGYIEPVPRERQGSFSTMTDWPLTNTATNSSATTVTYGQDYGFAPQEVSALGERFGVPGIAPDDAWPLLKARLLHVFEGSLPRPVIEDFNLLVSVHLRRCIQRRSPGVIIEDFTDLLRTGFASVDSSLRSVPDDRLVNKLVTTWSVVLSTVLPFLQSVFHPLDLELKGQGILSAREAADFWGAALPDDAASMMNGSLGVGNVPLLGEDVDTRRLILQNFRDEVFMPRYEQLLGIFSRLSLDVVNANVSAKMMLPPLLPPPPLMADGSGKRPGTSSSTEQAAAALSGVRPTSSSEALAGPGSAGTGDSISISAGHLSSSSAANSANRSRATSNTSAGSGSQWHGSPGPGPGHLTPLHQHQQYNPSHFSSAQAQAQLYAQHQQAVHETGARLTETIGRMLQCLSVLVSVQSGDEAQDKMEQLVKALKWNWLAGGRGRTGRQRRGFVGARVKKSVEGIGGDEARYAHEGVAIAA